MADREIIDSASVNADGTVSDGDVIIFQAGNVPVTTAVDQSGLGANGLAGVRVVNQAADIGTASAPFKAEISSGTKAALDIQGLGGTMYYTPDGNADFCDVAYVRGRMNLELIGTGTVTALEASAAKTNIAPTIVVPTLRMDGSAKVTMLDSSSTDPTLVELRGSSYLDMRRGATTFTQQGGAVRLFAGTNAITTYSMSGGVLDLEESGTFTTFNFYGGQWNTGAITRAITITTLNFWITPATLPIYAAIIANPLITIGTFNKIMRGA